MITHKSRGIPAYRPMVHKLIRFYCANPNRVAFRNSVERRNYLAVRGVLQRFSSEDRELIMSVLPGFSYDLNDSYIRENLRNAGFSLKEENRFWNLLNGVDREIAMLLGYIARPDDLPCHLNDKERVKS